MVLLNLELTDEEAKEFVAFQRQLAAAAPFKRDTLSELLLGKFPLQAKAAYLETFKRAIRQKWSDKTWDEGELLLLASAMLDSMTFLGGLSTASALEYMLAVVFMEGEPGASLRLSLDLSDAAAVQDLVWETLRLYPRVSGVPRWTTDDHGSTWQHEVASLQMALQDPKVFTEPLRLAPGRAGLNHEDNSLSIGFADFAVVDNNVSHPHSYACPAKQLSLTIMEAFLLEFHTAGPWQVEDRRITLNGYGTSGFTLRRLHQMAAG